MVNTAALLTGCGDPLFTSFVVNQADDRTFARDGAVRIADDADSVRSPVRQGSQDAAIPTGILGVPPLLEDGCFALPDLSVSSTVDSSDVRSLSAASLGCESPDGGLPQNAGTVFSRRNSMPLLEAGQRYSFRWGAETVMMRVRLLGGNESCPTNPVVYKENSIGLVSSDLGVVLGSGFPLARCHEFTAPQTVDFVRIYGHAVDFYSLSSLDRSLVFMLCPSRCPDNTQVVQDAGVPDAGRVPRGVLAPTAP
jgi:hypothetical protein